MTTSAEHTNADPLTNYLVAMYGAQVAKEVPLIESVLARLLGAKKLDQQEADLDTICRERQAKLNVHKQQQSDEPFEALRLLNMLYEGCLRDLNEAAAAYEQTDSKLGHHRCTHAAKIIEHLSETTDTVKGGPIASELLRLNEFALGHLAEAVKENSADKVRAVHNILRSIYLGYLELEIQQDIEEMLAKRSPASSSIPAQLS